MELLTAAIDVVAQPGREDLRTAQVSRPQARGVAESAVEAGGKELLSERADIGVLVWDVPVVPDEALSRRAPPRPETLVEDATHFPAPGKKSSR